MDTLCRSIAVLRYVVMDGLLMVDVMDARILVLDVVVGWGTMCVVCARMGIMWMGASVGCCVRLASLGMLRILGEFVAVVLSSV